MRKVRKVRRKRNKGVCSIPLFFIIAVILCVSGCGEKSQAPVKKESAVSAKKVIKKKVKKSIKEVKDKEKASEEVVAYHYDPKGKKDPFKPVVFEEKKITQNDMSEGPLTPLQKYTLTELKLVAIIMEQENPRAMVEDSKGDGYILSKGTLIGDQHGKVSEIKKNEVVVVEKLIDPDSGEIIKRNVSLILYKTEEEEL